MPRIRSRHLPEDREGILRSSDDSRVSYETWYEHGCRFPETSWGRGVRGPVSGRGICVSCSGLMRGTRPQHEAFTTRRVKRGRLGKMQRGRDEDAELQAVF